MATWLKNFLAPLQILVGGTAQSRDDRVNFRNGFIASQVPDVDGVNVLTVDTNTGSATVAADPNTIPLRNGSGALAATTFTGTSFSYSTPVTITRDTPFGNTNAEMVAGNGWLWSFSRFPATSLTGALWACDIEPTVGSLLKSVSVVYTPPAGHVALPAGTDRSQLLLVSYLDDGTSTAVGSVYDNPADIPSYEVNRTLTLSLGAGVTVLAGTRYVVLFRSETGVNALTGTILYRQGRWTADVTGP